MLYTSDERLATSDGVGFKGWGILLGVPALFLLAYFYPLIPYFATVPTCAVRHFLHVPCPGCGLTTSFTALAHMGFRRSIDDHPLGIVIAFWLVYLFLREVYNLLSGRNAQMLLKQQQRDFVLAIFLLALFVQWGVRIYCIMQ